MRLAITSLSMLLILAGIAQAIPNPASVYCTQLGYDLQIRTDEHGNQYGVCVFPDGDEIRGMAFYRKCYLGDTSVNCSRECEELPCRRAGDPFSSANAARDSVTSGRHIHTPLIAMTFS